jgi:hypothetical protein
VSHLNSTRGIIEKTRFLCAKSNCLLVICPFKEETIASITSSLEEYCADVQLPDYLHTINLTTAGQEVSVFTSVKTLTPQTPT